MPATAVYRLPRQRHCTWIEQRDGTPAELLSCVELNHRSGFVVAPFAVTPRQPVVLIRPDVVETLDFPVTRDFPVAGASQEGKAQAGERSCYAIDFANFHSQLEAGRFQKIVLSRSEVEHPEECQSAIGLFNRACEMYPRMLVALVSTPQSGTWLTATPEILLEGKDHQWRTIALAGTMKLTREEESYPEVPPTVAWSTKDIQEQRIVATYITECLERFTSDFQEEGPVTARAANLMHLRSDFTFTLPDEQRLGDVLQTLHPTPAVCGLPKKEAFDFILRNENAPRRYYSGFMGPLGISGETHLYVSLRCMQFLGDRYELFAGGGLLRDSTEEQEWNETEAKLDTMRNLLREDKR